MSTTTVYGSRISGICVCLVNLSFILLTLTKDSTATQELRVDLNSSHYLFDHNVVSAALHGYIGDDNNNIKNYPQMSNSHRVIKESRRTRHKRETDDSRSAGFKGFNETQYIKLALVADQSVYQYHQRNLSAVHVEMLELVKNLMPMYAPLNISVSLVGMVVWTEADVIDFSNRPLHHFAMYSQTKLDVGQRHDTAHLMTRRDFGYQGLALCGNLCTKNCAALNRYWYNGGDLAWTVAHEMGHTLGMPDQDRSPECKCPTEKCIMGANGPKGKKQGLLWSDCDLKIVETDLKKGSNNCFRNKPKWIITKPPTCGNGIIEPGEQCDCGGKVGDGINQCQACCHPETCLLRTNVTCEQP